MTTQTPQTTAPETHETTPVLPLPASAARLLTAAGAVAAFASTFLAWTWTEAFPGNLTVYGYPGGLQILTLVGSVLTALYVAAGHGIRGTRWAAPSGADKATFFLAAGTFAVTWYTVLAIAVDLGGLVNLEPGGYIAALATLVLLAGALGLPLNRRTLLAPGDTPPPPAGLSSTVEILLIAAGAGIGLTVFSYGIGTEYSEAFIGFLLLTIAGGLALSRAGLLVQFRTLTRKHRNIAVAAAFVAAALFPFTQTSETYTSVGTSILIFGTAAIGLNVVVGLAGLLDLGYVAFLGVGAYTAALVSGAPTAAFDVKFPFWAAVLTGAVVSMIFGVIIGAPTLRVRGDYLAIVTLGFGEIFRIGMQNLDGASGPDVTNGPNGIPGIPEIELLGFNLGEEHTILGFELGKFSNYLLLMLLFTAIIVTVFHRSDRSRIGRAWVAIREDETAAGAMGINTFRLKLMAFALGATLAGLAGTVLAHVESGVHPEGYKFVHQVPPNSAFLLVAVILGGMGTISGPLIGAALLYLIPNKLQFVGDYQLLFFGIALVLLMRFRPEGLLADRRNQLEFHENEQTDVPENGSSLRKAGA
ncbi:branched-chain amino acid ABC transporter permease [Streptomyces sp. JJ36]|uniref:branched-chain amino acid ABC transporter permease n=1 Tax=Streptomyces sp. JJ36 TaxID=2736645 RepID=UPI001F363CE7|nr:branched-chain amino acid ABC transporter permease [Streptomyces sp. JJ36]MCF6521551.1 branched-chain amino acid ABC transporter permease [Streptomyces sp. JJ36]